MMWIVAAALLWIPVACAVALVVGRGVQLAADQRTRPIPPAPVPDHLPWNDEELASIAGTRPGGV